MIALCKETNTTAQSVLTLVLTPNRSMDWQGNLQVILALAILITIGATPLILMGGWVVIIFAFLQILLLAVGLYITLRKLEYHEVLTLQGSQLSFQRGSARREGQFGSGTWQWGECAGCINRAFDQHNLERRNKDRVEFRQHRDDDEIDAQRRHLGMDGSVR